MGDTYSAYQYGNYELKIFFRHGNQIQISEPVNAADRGKQYITVFNVGRGVDTESHFSFTIRDIGRNDDLYKRLAALNWRNPVEKEDQLFTNGKDVTWKQILEVGNVVKIRVNDEFRGVFFVSTIQRSVNFKTTGYTIGCIGVQTWLKRQSVVFEVGAEILYQRKNVGAASKFLDNFTDYFTSDTLSETSTPQLAIEFLINDLLIGFLNTQYGDYSFNDGSSITDMIGLALSDVSYYGLSLILTKLPAIMGGGDYSIWDAIMQYKSAPFHEIWVTTGGTYLQLYDMTQAVGSDQTLRGSAKLDDDVEYIVFRPTPYDDPVIVDKEISDNGNPPKTITLGTLDDFSLHTVDATHSGIDLASDQIIQSDLGQSDDNLYSVYKVVASGARISGGAADINWPPIMDNEALRQVGKRVYTAIMEGLDMGSLKGKQSDQVNNTIQYIRVLQAKAYNWFKYNARFNKGTVEIAWMPNIYEGTHINISSDYRDENGCYYLNAYTLSMADNKLTYSLQLTRGFPDEGFPATSTDYLPTKTDKISQPPPPPSQTATSTKGNVKPVMARINKKSKKQSSVSKPTGKSGGGGGKPGAGSGRYTRLKVNTILGIESTGTLLIIDNKKGYIYNSETKQIIGNISYGPDGGLKWATTFAQAVDITSPDKKKHQTVNLRDTFAKIKASRGNT